MNASIRAIALLAVLAAAPALADNAGNGARNANSAGPSGSDLYSHICQGCHMPQAQGAAGAGHYPALAGDKALAAWQTAAITVLLGRHDMPAFGKPADPSFVFGEVHLSDAEIAAVINYVRSHFGNQYKDQVTEAQIAALPHPIG